MKKLSIALLAVVAVISLTQCNNSTPEKICSDATSRGKIISELVNNDAYMNEVMDAMKTKHGDVIASTCCNMMKNDQAMGTKMMDNMMGMCSSDSSMCKMMMGKTMDMCDADQSKCKMMMESMTSHPKGMESMQDMGMCDMKGMKGMKMDEKKEDHSQHHKK
jgi:hypothetical protein